MSETLSGTDRVNRILDMLGGNAILLPIPSGQKFPDKIKDVGWNAYGPDKMADPDYLARFNNGGNVGVLLGKPSGGLCSIDIDEDELIDEFLKDNPALKLTLRTRRLKGCNLWLWVKGQYPRLKPFHHARINNDKGKPKQIGEWRSTGGQTVIEGQVGGIEYSRVISAKPVTVEFSDIVWPTWIQDPPALDEPFQHESKSGPSLDRSKLKNLREYPSGLIKSGCPACIENGEDSTQNHLQIKPDGRFGCCKYPDDREHRREIWRLAGIPKSPSDNGDPFYELPKSPGPDLPEIIDSALFVAKEIRASPEIIKGLLHKGAKMVIGGGSKSFKTWVQLHVAIALAYGLDWLGFKTIPGKVLFVNFEIQEEFFQQRIRKIAEALSIPLEEGR